MTESQKITWAVYKSELDKLCKSTKEIRADLLKKARFNYVLSICFSYPIKILLGSTVSGGVVQMVTTADNTLISITTLNIIRVVLELLVLFLVVTKDFFEFETQIEKYYTAAAAIETFYKTVKYQSFHMKGTEGDRLGILLSFKNIYDEIVSNNKIIQTVEDISPPSMDSASTSSDNEENQITTDESRRRQSVTNRMMYMQSMLDRIPN